MPRSHTEDDIITLHSLHQCTLLIKVITRFHWQYFKRVEQCGTCLTRNKFYFHWYICVGVGTTCIRHHQATDVESSTIGGQITFHLLLLCSLLSVVSLLFQFLYYHGGTIYSIYVVASCVLIKDCSVIPGITSPQFIIYGYFSLWNGNIIVIVCGQFSWPWCSTLEKSSNNMFWYLSYLQCKIILFK